MDYLVELVKSNRSEVAEVFANDPSLRIEVEYDIRQYDIAKTRRFPLEQSKPNPPHTFREIDAFSASQKATMNETVIKCTAKERSTPQNHDGQKFTKGRGSELDARLLESNTYECSTVPLVQLDTGRRRSWSVIASGVVTNDENVVRAVNTHLSPYTEPAKKRRGVQMQITRAVTSPAASNKSGVKT